MEGTIGEIRAFAGNFAPRTWLFCYGQSLPISQYQALYAVIGTIYGGDGVNTFALPNIASRIVVGAGQGPGLSFYHLGQVDGEDKHTLFIAELPAHVHKTTATYSTTAASANISLNGVAAPGLSDDPTGNYLAQESTGTDYMYVASSSSPTLIDLDSNAAQVTNLSPPIPNIAIGITGTSIPHNNIQPVLALNYVICVEGLFPARN